MMRANPSRFSPRALDVLTGASVLLAVMLLLWPTRAAVQPVPPSVPPAKATAAVAGESSNAQLATQIVDGNVFSATRRAPTLHFVPPGSEAAGMQGVAPAMSDGMSGDNGMSVGTNVPRLFGIVAQDGRRRALLQLPGADSVPRLLDIGDKRGGYRVVSISEDRVVLASSTGSRTVRLVSRTSPDSLENLP